MMGWYNWAGSYELGMVKEDSIEWAGLGGMVMG